ncbi:MAG: autotransporter outer membrane beta-barrel domain-containing protein, partial [Gammaproteobacteria bacterium]|nr:autotransporter outer membrane beta-barrel domain-containing protein [Gammaproteobacteria bacterium]
SGCMCINTVPSLNGIAKKMDDLSGNNNFQPVLDVLTQQTSQKAFENKLEQLAPTGLNGMHIVMAQVSNGAEQVLLRLDTLRAMGTGGALARTGYIRTGYAAGDVMEDRASFSPVIFGNSTKQSSIQGLSGYDAATAGFGFLGDAPILEHFRVGLGVSYANSVVRQSNNTGSHTTIGSTQGMAYGSTTYGRLFLDAVLSAGINNYKGKRNVSFIGPTATSRYNGFQYGAKVKTGFAIPCDRIDISPIAAAQYMHLNVGQYTEQGAGALLNQHIGSMQANTVRVSLGGRIAESNQEGTFFPEFHAFYINDVKNPQMIITSQFVEGGGSFDSKSVVPPREGINAGASITAMVSDDFTLSGGYDLEAKRSFKSHSASLKFKFLF